MTPREGLPKLDEPSRLERAADVPVWAITCFYVRKGHRRQGITSALITSALDLARSAGAAAVEAYPLDGAVSPSSTGTGYASTFAKAGFIEVARPSRVRPTMRFTFAGQEDTPQAVCVK